MMKSSDQGQLVNTSAGKQENEKTWRQRKIENIRPRARKRAMQAYRWKTPAAKPALSPDKWYKPSRFGLMGPTSK